MKIAIDGTRYQNFESAEAVSRLDSIARTFSFEPVSQVAAALPYRTGDACTIWVDDEQIMEGFIPIIVPSGDATNHKIELTGRSKTGDLLDSMLGNVGANGKKLGDIVTPTSLARIAELVIAHLGMGIKVIDNANPDLFAQAYEAIAPDSSETAFEFLERMARKKQVLLGDDADSNLVIHRGKGFASGAKLINRELGAANNVLTYEGVLDDTGRFFSYESVSSFSLPGIARSGGVSVSQIVDQRGRITDNAIRASRQMSLVSESMFASGDGKDRAVWERNIRRARGRRYIATVAGYRNSEGALWVPGMLVDVDDDYTGMHLQMMIVSCTYRVGKQEGRTTQIECLEPDAFSLTLEEPPEEEEFVLG